MRKLLTGIHNFSTKVFPKQQKHFEALSQGQNPHTLLITCSDSRIDPILVTQTKPGVIFIVRNVGNIIPPYGASRGCEEAAIEFAVDGLNVKNIVVCGHSQCGAMTALASNRDLDTMPAVKRWLDHAQSTKRRMIDNPSSSIDQVIDDNVLVQVDNLKTHPAVSAAIRSDRVRVFGWVYNFESGSISVYDRTARAFINCSSINIEASEDVERFAL